MTNRIVAAISCLTTAQRLMGGEGKMLLVASDKKGRKSIEKQTTKMIKSMVMAARRHCDQIIKEMGGAEDEGNSW